MGHRILYLHAAPGIPVGGESGSSRHVREFVRAAAAEGHEVTVLCRRLVRRDGDPPPALPARVEVLQPGGIPGLLRRNPVVDEVAYDMRFLHRARELAREVRPTVVYERYSLFSTAGVRLGRESGTPAVVEVNAPLARERVLYEGLARGPHLGLAERAVLAPATRLVVVSTALADYVAGVPGVAAERIRVVPNGVDADTFAPRPRDPALEARVGSAGRFVLGFVGSLKPWHAVDNLIRAVAALEGQGGAAWDPLLLVVGDGPARPRLQSLVDELSAGSRVFFGGAVPESEVPRWMALFDVACAPYPVLEPFWYCPIKVVEAMAMELPVLASRSGDLPRLLGPQGPWPACGVLVPPGEPAGYVEQATRLWRDPGRRGALGREGRRRVLDGLTWRHAVRAALEGL